MKKVLVFIIVLVFNANVTILAQDSTPAHIPLPETTPLSVNQESIIVQDGGLVSIDAELKPSADRHIYLEANFETILNYSVPSPEEVTVNNWEQDYLTIAIQARDLSGDWCFISFRIPPIGGGEGWLLCENIQTDVSIRSLPILVINGMDFYISSTKTFTVGSRGVNIRTLPDAEEELLGFARKDTVVKVLFSTMSLTNSKPWYYVQSESLEGWTFDAYLDITEETELEQIYELPYRFVMGF